MVKKNSKKDLNKYELLDDEPARLGFRDNSISSKDKVISVFFRDIKSHLIKEIKTAEVIVGCVAWLTDKEILEALAEKKAVSIIVQKEDFLRPDIGDNLKNLKSVRRRRYSELKGTLYRYMFPFSNILRRVSTNSEEPIEAVRCVGVSKGFIRPRMHNKFLLFCKLVKEFEEQEEDEPHTLIPYAVWTGSFNLTQNASNSLENGVLIKDRGIAWAYFREYSQICAISEPLDWKSEWVEPEWRIGT